MSALRAPDHTPKAFVLSGGHLADGRVVDVTIVDGCIRSITAPSAQGMAVRDVAGFLVLPAAADPHIHLDKALTLDGPAAAGAGIRHTIRPSRQAPSEGLDDLARRARRVLEDALAAGVTVMRAHCDVRVPSDVDALRVLVELKHAVADVVALQVGPLVVGPSRFAAIESAVAALDIDFIGSCPNLEPSPVEAIIATADLAERAGLPLDLHIDETVHADVLLTAVLLDVITERPALSSVTLAHCVSLGAQDRDVRQRVIGRLRDRGVAIVALPQTNLYIQPGGPTARGVPLPPCRELLAAGVTLGAGSDNIQDAFDPIGGVDPLSTAALLVLVAHVTPDEAIEAVTTGARTAIGVPGSGLAIGASADLMLVRAASVADALARRSADRRVYRNGALVAHSRVETWTALP